MSSSTLVCDSVRSHGLARVVDFLDLTKPRIASMVLVTVAASAMIAGGRAPDPVLLLSTLLGTGLVAASASAMNHWLERRSDALMPRTSGRPLVQGRLGGGQALAFAGLLVVGGTLQLAWTVNLATAGIGLLTWLLYVCVYTPLKKRTAANTMVGAVAGALPVLMGWTCLGRPLGLEAATLFLVVFLWQFPHFMAIAWIYRRQYQAAGMKMLTVVDPSGRRAGAQAVLGALALVPVSLVPALHLLDAAYFAGALALGTGQLICAAAFMAELNERSARRLLRASLIYLPCLLLLMVLMPLA
jgi:heme o synthase